MQRIREWRHEHLGHCCSSPHHGWLNARSFSHGCCGSHLGTGADIIIDAVPGERRIVAYEVVNDSKCDVSVQAEVGPLHNSCSEEVIEGGRIIEIVPGGLTFLAPCERARYRIRVDTDRLAACAIYEGEIRFKGTCCVARVRIRLKPLVPIICRHDTSHLRAWLKQCCFGAEPTKIWAPAQVHGNDCGCC
jgi:hypothetical protein